MVDKFTEKLVRYVSDDDAQGLGRAGSEASGQFVGCIIQFFGNLKYSVAQCLADAFVLGFTAEDKGNRAS